MRADFLFDFCTGYAKGYRVGKRKPAKTDRLHDGYGGKKVSELIPLDIQQWLNSHAGWGPGTKKTALSAVKRAFNYAVEMGKVDVNPIKGFKAGKLRTRVTYFTDEQEAALLKHASKQFALALRVCIRTGARPGSEFAKLTAGHVIETPRGQIWKFSPEESKNGKERRILVAGDIAEIVRQRIKLHPTGPLFLTPRGRPWTEALLGSAFWYLKKKLAASGIKLDADACMYSTRHTFAKRTIGGFWTGRQCSIEQLAGLMGNSRQVCWDHYAKWCDSYIEPLWDAINGSKTA
jgi:integrase